jgi:hypothetical protein
MFLRELCRYIGNVCTVTEGGANAWESACVQGACVRCYILYIVVLVHSSSNAGGVVHGLHSTNFVSK